MLTANLPKQLGVHGSRQAGDEASNSRSHLGLLTRVKGCAFYRGSSFDRETQETSLVKLERALREPALDGAGPFASKPRTHIGRQLENRAIPCQPVRVPSFRELLRR